MTTAEVSIGGWPTADAIARLGDAPLGVYVHVPFCATRCGYCAFTTTATRSDIASYRAYVDTAINQIRQLAERTRSAGRTPAARTVYFGGGTPTQLPSDMLAELLDALTATFAVDGTLEVTIEANPEHLDPASANELLAAGFTRISCGVQSTNSAVLSRLERTHHPERALDVLSCLASIKGLRVSADLMIGSPGESTGMVVDSLDAIVATGVGHISAYLLGVEPGTRLAHQVESKSAILPPDESVAERYRLVDNALGAYGFSWYEISNWARAHEDQCEHNRIYWTSGDWIGIGPGAHSHVSGERWWTSPPIGEYLDGHVRTEGERVSEENRALERVMLDVRLRDGIDPSRHPRVPALAANASRLVDSGLLYVAPGGRLCLTQEGRLLADRVVLELVTDDRVRTRRAAPAPPARPDRQRPRS